MSNIKTETVFCEDIKEMVTAILRTNLENENPGEVKWFRRVRYCTGQTMCFKNRNNLCPFTKAEK